MAGRNHRRRRGSGFTLFEIAITIAILILAVASTSAATISLSALRRENRESAIAQDAARVLADRVLALGRGRSGSTGGWARDVTDLVCTPNSLGVAFDVPGLEPLEGMAHVGSITFIVDETRTDLELGVPLGMPRDLDGDGFTDGTNVLSTARLLPAIIELRWQGVRGEQRLVHPFLVVGY